MLRLKANKKLIQDKLASTTGKVVLLKDLTNISSRIKSADTRNDIQESIRSLTEVYGTPISESYLIGDPREVALSKRSFPTFLPL